jgi:hypothetical protein
MDSVFAASGYAGHALAPKSFDIIQYVKLLLGGVVLLLGIT